MYVIDKKHYFYAVRNQTLFYHIQNAETIDLPRAEIANDTKYNLTITAYNHFGESQSDPFSFCVKEISKFLFLISL